MLKTISLLFCLSFGATAAEKATDLGAIWFIGDSITQSNADGDPNGSPRKSLHDQLKKKGYNFSYTGHHAKNTDGLPASDNLPADNLYHYHTGISGFLIGNLNPKPGTKKHGGIANNLKKYWNTGRLAKVKPDVILIMIGTNDVGRGYELEAAPQRLQNLLDMIYDLPEVGDPKVFLATIPPNRRKESDRTNVMIFNESIPEMVNTYKAKGKKIFFVDQFTPIDQAYEANMRKDNLHPNGTGNDTMALQWLNAIEASNQTNSKASIHPPSDTTSEHNYPGEKTDFRGYDSYQLTSKKGKFKIICPKKTAPGKPWIWRSLFWERLPLVRSADLQLVEKGYHVVIVYGDVAGHPSGNANIDAAYELVTEEYGFSKTFSMAAISRGNLSLFRWASENPEKVESIYVDNGVCNVASWPAGRLVPGSNSIGSGDKASWEGFKKKFGFKTDAEALAGKQSPIDLLEPLAKANVPILMMCGTKDTAVPYPENGVIMKERYTKLGGSIEIMEIDKGHSHGLKDPTRVIEFILSHTLSPEQ